MSFRLAVLRSEGWRPAGERSSKTALAVSSENERIIFQRRLRFSLVTSSVTRACLNFPTSVNEEGESLLSKTGQIRLIGVSSPVNGRHHSGGYDFATGRELWRYNGCGDIPVQTPIVVGDPICTDVGLLTAFDTKTGEIRYSERLS